MDYTYSVVTDTLNAAIATDSLYEAILVSSITIQVDLVSVSNDIITITFATNLSTSEKTTLDSLIANHDGIALKETLATQPVELVKKSPLTGRPEVVIVESEGDGETLPSHNFMDRTTWYQGSLRVMGEVPVLDIGKTYNLVNSDIIDLTHGKITFEDDITGHEVKAYDGVTELVIETEFTVDYSLGKITLDASYTLGSTLTVDYSYASVSTFVIKPATGKILSIKDAEIQFTDDLIMKPMTFEIWAYNPNDLPNKVPVFSRRYKSIKDIINIARQGKGSIPAIDVFTKPILVFPFSYDRKIALEDSKGMELRVRTDGDLAMGGEYGTITFYVTYENE